MSVVCGSNREISAVGIILVFVPVCGIIAIQRCCFVVQVGLPVCSLMAMAGRYTITGLDWTGMVDWTESAIA